MFDFISKLFPAGTQIPQNFKLKNTYIKYGITTTIKLWLKGAFGILKDTRKNAFLGNMASLLGHCQGELIVDCGIFDGMNSDIFGPDGYPDLGLADECMRKNTIHRSDIYATRVILEDNLLRANIVGPIYNMLRMFMIKTYAHLEYKGRGIFYDNGHVQLTNTQAFAQFDDTTLGLSVSIKNSSMEITAAKGPITDQGDTVYYAMGSSLDATSVAIISMAHSEWQSTAPFLVSHSSPQLIEQIAFVGSNYKPDYVSWKDIRAVDVKSTLAEFVRRHNAYRDFEIAYGMLCGVLTRPVPRSAEALIWSKKSSTVNIPKPFCFRGIAHELYAGRQYIRGPEWQDTFYSWYSNSTAVVGQSIALMEAVYTELFHLTRLTEFHDIDKFNFMQYAAGTVNAPSTGVLVDIALACLRYGKEYDARYLYRAGVDRIDTIPGLKPTDLNITVKDSAARESYNLGDIVDGIAPLNVLEFAPVTYPSLSYGVNEDGYYMNGDVEHIKTYCAPVDGEMVFTDPAEFSKFMSMMRLFGYDVKARRSSDERMIYNWADNASGRYIYVHDPNDRAPRFVINQADIKERKNSWIKLPVLFGDLEFGYELGDKALTWFSGDERIGFGQAPALSVKRSEYVQAVAKLTQARPTVKIIPLHRRSDFRETRILVPPSRPTLAPTSLETAGAPIITDTGTSATEVAAELPQEAAAAI